MVSKDEKLYYLDSQGKELGIIPVDLNNLEIKEIQCAEDGISFIIHANDKKGTQKQLWVGVTKKDNTIVCNPIISIATKLEEVTAVVASAKFSHYSRYKLATLDSNGILQTWDKFGTLIETEAIIYPPGTYCYFSKRGDWLRIVIGRERSLGTSKSIALKSIALAVGLILTTGVACYQWNRTGTTG